MPLKTSSVRLAPISRNASEKGCHHIREYQRVAFVDDEALDWKSNLKMMTVPMTHPKLLIYSSIMSSLAALILLNRSLRPSKKVKTVALSYPGLLNVGNTCYLNSCLQFLASSQILRNYLQNINLTLSALSEEVSKILEELQPTEGRAQLVDPRPFLVSVFGSLLAGAQQDAHEFLLILLSRLVKPNVSAAHAIVDYTMLPPMTGMAGNWIVCMKCLSHVSLALEPFSVLTIETAEKHDNIQGLVTSYWNNREYLEGYKCASCEGVNCCFRQNKLLRAPSLLILHVNRIKMFGTGLYKDMRRLRIQEVIRLDKKAYRLKSVVEHVGSAVQGGHYVAYRRASPSAFIQISDSAIGDPIKLSEISQAYLLMYEA